MKTEVVAGIKNLIKHRSENLAELYIDWFGGEPLLSFDMVSQSDNYVAKYTLRY